MPLTTTEIPDFSDGDTITAAGLNDRFSQVENWLNYGIVAGELYSASAWVDAKLIYRPDFYGSPAPRQEAVSGDTHWRTTRNDWYERSVHHNALRRYSTSSGDNEGWAVVKNGAVTFKVQGAARQVDILCSCYWYETGGDLGASSGGFGFEDIETSGNEAAEFALFADGEALDATYRTLYAHVTDFGGYYDTTSSGGIEGEPLSARKQFSFMATTTMGAGVHSASLRVRVYTGTQAKHVWSTLRNFTCEVLAI